ncbi:MAG: hypothetical protein UY50_C0017G0016 [Parcubacteria group bacterium GW2011_GWA2_49_9]|nr:MAG: hypothetical protein UY50_C0017G0016 [Parcubacteria group bacterium GW2011_GWA2_49_9]
MSAQLKIPLPGGGSLAITTVRSLEELFQMDLTEPTILHGTARVNVEQIPSVGRFLVCTRCELSIQLPDDVFLVADLLDCFINDAGALAV